VRDFRRLALAEVLSTASGGYDKVVGVMLATVMLQMLASGLNLLGVAVFCHCSNDFEAFSATESLAPKSKRRDGI
jgi:hypothetical protein